MTDLAAMKAHVHQSHTKHRSGPDENHGHLAKVLKSYDRHPDGEKLLANADRRVTGNGSSWEDPAYASKMKRYLDQYGKYRR